LVAQPPARLVVSSFHRAKGLEFDRVLVVDPGPLREKSPEDKSKKVDRDPAEEARLLYVAMTRARHELYLVPAVDMRKIRIHDATDRWGRYFFQRWRRDGLELRGGDVATEYPAGSVDFEADAAAMQHYLATAVRPGDAVELTRV